MEEEMILEPEGPGRALLSATCALQQLSSATQCAQIRLTCTYYAALWRNGNRRKTEM